MTWCSRVRSPVADAKALIRAYRALCARGLEPADAERRVFSEGGATDGDANLYEKFLQALWPDARKTHGVYFTPSALVHAQVRLVDDLLRTRMECAQGFADPRVAIVDPATGSGAYPLAIRAHLGRSAPGELEARMWLFETRPGAAALARVRGVPVNETNALNEALQLHAPIVACIGNPPYRRQAADAAGRARVSELRETGAGIHAKNVYNDYVYFWRWAVRTVCEWRSGPGVVCFVTAASYVRGPGFGGVRRMLRAAFDELWVIDLEGDQRAARATDNVFAIRTPIAVAIGARYADTATSRPGDVHYARLAGSAVEKATRLDGINGIADLAWQSAPHGWSDPLTGRTGSAYALWPALTDLFPWQVSGAQLKRTWPIGITPDVLQRRWRHLLALPGEERRRTFGETRDRSIDSSPTDLVQADTRLVSLRDLDGDAACLEPVRYAYRAFDRHWVLPDARCGDFMRPKLWRSHGPRQLYLTTMLTNVLGPGPAAIVTNLVPDLDQFRGSFGALGVVPLWKDAAATRPNVAASWRSHLSQVYGLSVRPEALMAYCYALLAAPSYVGRFAEELRTPGPRVPLTGDADLFGRAVALGETLVRLHTYAEVPRGRARLLHPVGEPFPTGFGYADEVLSLGAGRIGPIAPEVWAFSVSGYAVLRGWLRRRTRRGGKSPLDRVWPERWPTVLTRELLELVWLVEATLRLQPRLDAILDDVVSSGRLHVPTLRGDQRDDLLGAHGTREDEPLPQVAPELFEAVPL